jgi:hypothetical protein
MGIHTEAPATYTRTYDGHVGELRHVRLFLAGILDGWPVADDAILLGNELASNAIQYSAARKPGGRFTVRVDVYEPDYVWIEVQDGGGPPWEVRSPDGEPWHGLDVVRLIAGKDNWGIEGSPAGWVVWVRLDLVGSTAHGQAPAQP